jgi:hypothetical protein
MQQSQGQPSLVRTAALVEGAGGDDRVWFVASMLQVGLLPGHDDAIVADGCGVEQGALRDAAPLVQEERQALEARRRIFGLKICVAEVVREVPDGLLASASVQTVFDVLPAQHRCALLSLGAPRLSKSH